MNRRNRPDPATADRLLAGRIAPDDAPPGYRRVAELLGEAGGGFSEPAGGPAQATMISAMVAAIQAEPVAPIVPGRKSMLRKVLAAKTIAIASVLALSASGAAAATGNLPDSVQTGVSKAAKHVGLDLPEGKGVKRITETCPDGQTFRNRGQYLKWVRENNPAGLEAAKASTCGMPVNSKGTPGADEPENESPSQGHGKSGEDHGKSGESHGQSGEKGQAGGDPAAPPENPAPVETPAGSIDTGTEASDGAAQTGADHAGAAGDNAGDHPTPDDHPGQNS